MSLEKKPVSGFAVSDGPKGMSSMDEQAVNTLVPQTASIAANIPIRLFFIANKINNTVLLNHEFPAIEDSDSVLNGFSGQFLTAEVIGMTPHRGLGNTYIFYAHRL